MSAIALYINLLIGSFILCRRLRWSKQRILIRKESSERRKNRRLMEDTVLVEVLEVVVVAL